jgi:CRP-like cAMP-binding protein
MMFESIFHSLQTLGRFSEGELTLFREKVQLLPVPKGGYLLREGQVCQAAYFINRGCFRHYQLNPEGEETTLDLFIANDWALDYPSFTAQKPARGCIQAAEEAEVLALDIHKIHALIGESPNFFALGRLMERGLTSAEIRTNDQSPEEKYRYLLATKPQLVQKFPLKHIASYLGVTPETLSRVRKKLTHAPDFLI